MHATECEWEREREQRRHSGMKKANLSVQPSCWHIPKRVLDIEKATEKCIDLQQNCFAHQVDSVISPLPRRTERIQACFQTYSNNKPYAQCRHTHARTLISFEAIQQINFSCWKWKVWQFWWHKVSLEYDLWDLWLCYAMPMLLVGNFEKIKRLKQCS